MDGGDPISNQLRDKNSKIILCSEKQHEPNQNQAFPFCLHFFSTVLFQPTNTKSKIKLEKPTD